MESFILSLPDPASARVFLERLESLSPDRTALYRRDDLLVSRLLIIASHSPFLAETLLRHPEYIDWLKREGDLGNGKTVEQLQQDLARFVTRAIDADPQTRLARFKRRELLRIYLRDCLHVATLSEITEELSNLADAVLGHALAQAHQEMVNRFGAPLTRDGRRRIVNAEFAIVALGKLGCCELNYASDIDLLFLYSGEGETAGAGRNRQAGIDNKEFFTQVVRQVTQMIGTDAGEGAVYKIDLRLRPYGRDGDMVWEVERAADYYQNKAQNWERQALIRARCSAGSESVVVRFLDLVRDVIFHPEAVPDTIQNVRLIKEKIDRHEATRPGGFNVKLGRGGIREIEFIAQALQLAYGGREPWLRSAQTLIVLARLAEKGLLSETERARLSAAYTFFRTVEHRLQMEHGAQTHRLPIDRARIDLLARRCGYVKEGDLAQVFLSDLESHTAAVRAIYSRVFAETTNDIKEIDSPPKAAEKHIDDETERLIDQSAKSINLLMTASIPARKKFASDSDKGIQRLSEIITFSLASTINPLRSLRNLSHWAESLATYSVEETQIVRNFLSGAQTQAFIKRMLIILSSQYLSQALVSRPLLAEVLAKMKGQRSKQDFLEILRASVEKEIDPSSKTDALRRVWYRLVVEIGYRDLSVTTNLRANNFEQTALAEASLEMAVNVARESLGLPSSEFCNLPFAVLALGRLGHAGMDYGSDLDLLIVFDESDQWPPKNLKDHLQIVSPVPSPQEFYAKLASQIVRVLSTVTREGFLYRVDMRLRPDGKNGPMASGLASLIDYLRERASGWEHSAYLKVREVAGDLNLGERARRDICEAIFDASSRNPSIREELASIRVRLEKEKARPSRPDIKWGRGGMTDVYFVTRYLQLRDRVDYPSERGTLALIEHLGERDSLDQQSAQTLYDGYSFLRKLDHWMRLLLDRPTPILPASSVAIRDLARALGLQSEEEVESETSRYTEAIREVYEKVFA